MIAAADSNRAVRHKGMVFRAVVRHLDNCSRCKLNQKRFSFERACEIGVMLHDEYLLARSYVRSPS